MAAEEFLKEHRGYNPRAKSDSLLNITIKDVSSVMEAYHKQEFRKRVEATSEVTKFKFELDFETWAFPISIGYSREWNEGFLQILCFRLTYNELT